MRNYIFIFLLILNASNLHSQVAKLDSVLYQYSLNAPKTNNIEKLSRHLVNVSIKQREIVHTIYYWIAQNIQYDYKLSSKRDIESEQISVKNTLQRKSTICAGYAILFKEFCDRAKIECVIIEGIAKHYERESSGHAWNAVKIEDRWYLIDPTWGAGYVTNGGVFVKKLNMEYLFANPADLIIDHFPKDNTFQFLDHHITLSEFNSLDFENMRAKKFFNNLGIN